MPVYDLIYRIERKLESTNAKLESINSKLDNLICDDSDCVESDGITLFRRGRMIFWTKVEDALCYRLRLYCCQNEIDVIELDRNKAYHTFTDLVGKGVFAVKLEVENRDGDIINSATIEF